MEQGTMQRPAVGIVAILVAVGSIASDKETAAQEAALMWLDCVDSGRYEASWEYENKAVAIEMVTPILEDGACQVSGYHIR
jgi:hypothetical protein